MSDKYSYSLSRGIKNTIDYGSPSIGPEGDFHNWAMQRLSPKVQALRIDTPRERSFYAPIDLFMRRDLSAGGDPEFIAQLARGRSNLLTWSAVARAGAIFLDGLSGNETLWQISELPVPTWIAEAGMAFPITTPVFSVPPLANPKRLSASLKVSKMLLAQAGPDPKLGALLIADLSRQLGAYVDAVALLGQGPAEYQPTGVQNWSGVTEIPTAAPTWDLFVETEAAIEQQNVAMCQFQKYLRM
jgi:hypothetical protein